MKIQTIKNDLMTVDSKYVICHCISADCAMGAGVVVPIKNKYKGVKVACQNFADMNQVHHGDKGYKDIVGKAFRYKCDAGVVYNLFSKEIVRHKAGVGVSVNGYHQNLKRCLEDMKEQMIQNNEKYLAMPKIACGLDRCKWEDVEKIIVDVFNDTDIAILVCVL